MKRSRQVQLTLVTAVAAALSQNCSNRRYSVDPCQQEAFNPLACQAAVQGGGYYYGGTWFPQRYPYGYTHYYESYHTYTSRGGRVTAPPAETYSRPAPNTGPGQDFTHRSGSTGTPTTSPSEGVTRSGSGSTSSPSESVSRGGFGSSSASHGSGGSSSGE